MRSVVKDALFIGGCFLIIVAASVLLYADLNRDINRSVTDQIGTIVFKKKLAERKFTSQVLWSRIENNSPIFNYDTLRTDEDSLVVVNLNDGTEIELASNTLVLLTMKESLLDLKLEGGALSAQRGVSGGAVAPQSSVRISSGQSRIEMSDGEMIVTKDTDNNINVNVASGKAALVSNGGEKILSANQIASIDSKGTAQMTEAVYTSLNPPNSSVFVTAENDYKITLSWETEGSAAESGFLLISKDPFFRKDLKQIKIKAISSYSVTLPPAAYFWKLKGQQGGESSAARFTIVQDSSARQVSPSVNQMFEYTGNPPMVNFQWHRSAYSGSYIIEVFEDPEMKKKAQSLASRGVSISSNTFGEGTYFWRVRNIYGASVRGIEISSGLRSFTVSKITAVAAPVIIGSTDTLAVSKIALQKGRVVLSWKSSGGAEEYDVEIARDRSFNKKVITRRTRYNYFNPPAELGEGEYYWRVTAVAGTKRSAPSKENKLVVNAILKVETVSPRDAANFFPGRLGFSWNDINRGSSYALEVSMKDNFYNLAYNEKTSSRKAELHIVKPGNYFWRVRLLDSAGETLSVSSHSRFSVTDINPAPAIISPKQKLIVDKAMVKELAFQWKSDPLATHYKLLIYRGGGGEKEIFYQGVLTQPAYLLKGLSSLQEAEYIWEVTGLRREKGEHIPVTGVSKNVFTAVSVGRLAAPVIKMPDIIIVQ